MKSLGLPRLRLRLGLPLRLHRGLTVSDTAKGIPWLLVSAALGCCSSALALTIIHDSGDTIPIAPYLAPVRGESPSTGVRGPGLASSSVPEPAAGAGAGTGVGASTSDPLPFDIRYLLPLRSPGLEPGSLSGRSLPSEVSRRLPYLSVPVFVIGADRLSLAWLAQHRPRLLELGARGLLVQAETEADLLAVARAGLGLTIAPVPGGELVRALGLSRYPVLISSGGLSQ